MLLSTYGAAPMPSPRTALRQDPLLTWRYSDVLPAWRYAKTVSRTWRYFDALSRYGAAPICFMDAMPTGGLISLGARSAKILAAARQGTSARCCSRSALSDSASRAAASAKSTPEDA